MNARPFGRPALALASALLSTAALAPVASAQPVDPAPPSRVIVAAPGEGIRVDGALDEAAWAAAEPGTGFTQLNPTDGAPATQETEVRVLAGGDALYVGARLLDDPAAVRRPLGRRDDPGQSDLFLIALDAYNDRRTAYVFGVSAAGVLYDAVLQGGEDDESWNAVWEGAARMTGAGWEIEMRIPYSQLRFAEGTASWGVNFVRHIRRNTEQAFWAPFTQSQANAGIVQYFGRLEGVGGIRPRRVVQAAPYALSRARRFEDENLPGEADAAYALDAGADLKLGLASNAILDLTVNPDFGQVEADPAELNLSTFETFFDERRPFFLEGTQIFDLPIGNGDGALLYTRRIGADSRILGAAKVSGQTAGGLSFGALGAVTGDDVDPERVYGAARLRRQFGGTSFLGGGLSVFDFHPNTPTDPDDDEETARRSVAAAADWDVRLGAGDEWKLEGALAGAWQGVDGEDAARGYALYVGFDKVQGYFTPGSGIRFYSPDFQLNDVGRFRQADVIQARLGASYLVNQGQPIGPFRRFNFGGFGTQTWRYSDGTNQGFEFFGFGGGQLRNYHQLFFNLGATGLGGVDVRETRGLGPIVNVPGFNFNVNYGTDQRRQFRVYPGFYFGTDRDGATDFTGWTGVDWTASDRLTLFFNVFAEIRDGWRAWAANEGLVRTPDRRLLLGAEAAEPDEIEGPLEPLDLTPAETEALLAGLTPFDGAVTGDTVGYYAPVFGTRDTRQVSVTARASWLFSPRLSLQLYTQAFAARGRYHDWTLLVGTDDLRPFDAYPKRRDFARQSFNANAVLRWEYRPGSTLFVVWTQARGDDLDEELLLRSGQPAPNSPFETTTTGQFRDTFRLFPDNVFLVKLNYLLMR